MIDRELAGSSRVWNKGAWSRLSSRRIMVVFRWVCECEWEVVHNKHRLELDWLDREGAAVLGVDPNRPSLLTTTLNVDGTVEFGEFGCGD